MRLAWCLFLLVRASCVAADDSSAILQQIRATVAAQLSRTANYTCTETLSRNYFRPDTEPASGCRADANTRSLREIARDRLRLDVAVSEGAEIYAWHGQNGFSSSAITDVVSNGPISSGGFIGFLRNVFFAPGVQFRYEGSRGANGASPYTFTYSVPLAASRYHLQSRHGLPLVPFHGSFSAKRDDFELLTFEAVADDIPTDSTICSADTRVEYQHLEISGRKALVPSSFTLRVGDNSQLRTTSYGVYSQCREFRGESTLRFDADESSAPERLSAVTRPQSLPAGTRLHIGLGTPISDQTSFTGDAVAGTLLDTVIVSGMQQAIPAGTTVKGVITKLEFRSEPDKHFVVRIEWERLIAGNSQFTFRSQHVPSAAEPRKLWFMFGDRLPPDVVEELESGSVILPGRHVRLDRHFSGEWRTVASPAAVPAVHNDLDTIRGMSSLSRRKFVAQSAASLAVSRSLLMSDPLRHNNLGVQLYTVRNVIEKDPAATLNAIQSIGYTEVEAIYASLDKIWPALQKTKLKPVSVHADTQIFMDGGDKLESMLNNVRQRGFRYVVVPYIPPAQRGGADMFKHLANVLNKAGERARAHGLQLCYHNHAFEFAPVGESTGLELLMKNTQKDLVSLELDIFWVTVAGHNPVELLKTYSDRILLLHLKDKSRSFTTTQFNEQVPKDTFQAVGDGSINIPAVLAAAKTARVENYFVEQDQTPGDPIDSLRRSYSYLEPHFS